MKERKTGNKKKKAKERERN